MFSKTVAIGFPSPSCLFTMCEGLSTVPTGTDRNPFPLFASGNRLSACTPSLVSSSARTAPSVDDRIIVSVDEEREEEVVVSSLGAWLVGVSPGLGLRKKRGRGGERRRGTKTVKTLRGERAARRSSLIWETAYFQSNHRRRSSAGGESVQPTPYFRNTRVTRRPAYRRPSRGIRTRPKNPLTDRLASIASF